VHGVNRSWSWRRCFGWVNWSIARRPMETL